MKTICVHAPHGHRWQRITATATATATKWKENQNNKSVYMSHNEKMHSVHSTPAIKKMLDQQHAFRCWKLWLLVTLDWSISILSSICIIFGFPFIYFFLVLFVHLTSPKYLALCMRSIGTKPLLVCLVAAFDTLHRSKWFMLIKWFVAIYGSPAEKNFHFIFSPSLPLSMVHSPRRTCACILSEHFIDNGIY